MSKHTAEISKFLSFVLRHQPDAIGITLDLEGWTDIDALIAAAAKDGRALDRDLIDAIVSSSDKKRFAISSDGLNIRAVQGHSSASVDIQFTEKLPPEFLFHGTATRFIDSINGKGLLPGSRQHVHLSQDEATAITVGQRHGKPVVLKIKPCSCMSRASSFIKRKTASGYRVPYQRVFSPNSSLVEPGWQNRLVGRAGCLPVARTRRSDGSDPYHRCGMQQPLVREPISFCRPRYLCRLRNPAAASRLRSACRSAARA